jgi:hypothetical protein
MADNGREDSGRDREDHGRERGSGGGRGGRGNNTPNVDGMYNLKVDGISDRTRYDPLF